MYMLITHPADETVARSFQDVDAVMYRSRSIIEQWIFPAVDPLISTSRALDLGIVGEEHYSMVQAVRELLDEQVQI